MVRYLSIAILFILSFNDSSVAQFTKKIDSLIAICNKAASDSDKVVAYGKLAEYYYIYQLDNKADSIVRLQLDIAELSQSKNLFFTVYFGKGVMHISNWARKESYDKSLEFVRNGLDFSKTSQREDYVTLSYIRLAEIYRKKSEMGNAFYNANFAFTSSQNINNDSIKILAAIELGDVYLAKGESLLAFKTYTSAFDKAVELNNIVLQSEVYHRFSDLYQSLNYDLTAKEYLFKSLDLNKRNNNREGLIKDNIDLARLTEERFYIERALSLSDSLKLENYYIQAKRIMFGYYTYIIANSDSTLKFLNNNKDLTQTWINTGMPFYYMNIGSVYHYANKWDSAVYYLQLAIPGFEKDFNENNLQALCEEIGDCYSLLKKPQQAIIYFEKALALKTGVNNPVKAAQYSYSLSNLYAQIQDFKNAYYYSRQSILLKDSLQKLANQRDIALIEVNNEKKLHERELELITRHKLNKRNLQYMAITIAISIFFLMFILIGMFPVSRFTIKLLGYFAFISLFEFIVLLIDPFLHHISEGEPLLIWILKIILIALLVPLQHYMEHGLIHFLETEKKNKIFAIKKWQRKKLPPSNSADIDSSNTTIDDIEEETAVL